MSTQPSPAQQAATAIENQAPTPNTDQRVFFAQASIQDQIAKSGNCMSGEYIELNYTTLRPLVAHLMSHDQTTEAVAYRSMLDVMFRANGFGVLTIEKTFALRLVKLSERAVANQANGTVEQDTPENMPPPRRSAVIPPMV